MSVSVSGRWVIYNSASMLCADREQNDWPEIELKSQSDVEEGIRGKSCSSEGLLGTLSFKI